MVFPAGVITRTVTLPQIIDSFGQPVAGVMTITPSLPLKWEATDQLVLSDPIGTDIVAGTASVTLPIVQTGFVLQNILTRVDVWTYKAVLSLPAGVQEVPDLVFVLSAGTGDYMLDFATPAVIPESVITLTEVVSAGEPGPPNSLSVGTVTTGAPGSSAVVTITGTAPAQVVNFAIPRGDTGAPGSSGSAVGLPTGGTTGQLLKKNSNTDYDVGWTPAVVGVPAGGTLNQVLGKTSSSDYAMSWRDPSGGGASFPAGGATGTVLGKLSGVDNDVGWISMTADQMNFVYVGSAYPTPPATAPPGIKVRHFYGPVQPAFSTWAGVLDVYTYAEAL